MDYKLKPPSALDYFTALVQSDDEFPLLETAISLAQDEFPSLDIQQDHRLPIERKAEA